MYQKSLIEIFITKTKFGDVLIWFPIVNLMSQKRLILYLAVTNIKIRFKGTYLGFLWTGFEPLLTFIVLFVVFTSLRFSVQENFAIYLITGILLLHIFTRGTMGGQGSLRVNSGILQSLKIQKEFFPVTSTVAMAILSTVEVVILIALMPFFQFSPSLSILLIPIPIILMLFLVLGMSYILCIINAYVKDIQTIWAIVVHALFFASPIFWYLDDAEGILLTIQSINPVGQLIEITHKLVVFGEIPPLSEWLYTMTFVFGILIFGYAIFRKYEDKVITEF